MLETKPPPKELLEAIENGEELFDQGPVTTMKIRFHGKDAVVKYGTGVRRGEALAMDFVHRHAPPGSIPLPRLIGFYTNHETSPDNEELNTYYVVSEWIGNSKTLEEVWPLLLPSNKESIVTHLRSILRTLRGLKVPDGRSYIGSAGHLPCTDPLIRDMGPFNDISEFNDTYLKVAHECFRGHYIDIIKRLLAKSAGYQVVFTHGDLALSNILVRAYPDNSGVSSHEEWRIAALIDWECAGWYPEHWEYLKLLGSVKWKNDWASRAQNLLGKHYDEEFMIDVRLRMYYR